jgi:UDP:flavonoid glycosyltransferase YjiC (YdhE family)
MAAEALRYGVPIIGWPMAAEQFYNVKLLEEEIGVCLEVARGRISDSSEN